MWRDTTDLWPGEDWRAKIRQAITNNALVFIACFSHQSVTRQFSYQNEELVLAIEQLRRRRPGEPWLIPVRFDDCEIPDLDIGAGRTLATIHRADLFGDRFDENAGRLVKTILRILEPDSAIRTQAVSDWISANSGMKPTNAHVLSSSLDSMGNGEVITFYSHESETGKTMAAANIGWILAANGLRVLLLDCDLESPTLRGFLQPFLGAEQQGNPGVLDVIRSYRGLAATASEQRRIHDLIPQHTCVEPYAIPLNWQFLGGGLYFLPSGGRDRDNSPSQIPFNWGDFYARLNGGEFLDALGSDLRYHYDYSLICSPTGTSDLVDILTAQIPDITVDCFTYKTRSIEGAAKLAKSIGERCKDRGVRILPVPMRVEFAENRY